LKPLQPFLLQPESYQQNSNQREDDDRAALKAEAERIAAAVGGGQRVVS
jgi:hypothetical protein